MGKFAKFITDRELVSLEMAILTKEISSMGFFMEKVNLTGLMELSTKENSNLMRSPGKENTNGQISPLMTDKLRMVSDMVKELMSMSRKALNTKVSGSMVCAMEKELLPTKTAQFMKVNGREV
jgi:hypothetical protein